MLEFQSDKDNRCQYRVWPPWAACTAVLLLTGSTQQSSSPVPFLGQFWRGVASLSLGVGKLFMWPFSIKESTFLTLHWQDNSIACYCIMPIFAVLRFWLSGHGWLLPEDWNFFKDKVNLCLISAQSYEMIPFLVFFISIDLYLCISFFVQFSTVNNAVDKKTPI